MDNIHSLHNKHNHLQYLSDNGVHHIIERKIVYLDNTIFLDMIRIEHLKIKRIFEINEEMGEKQLTAIVAQTHFN